MKVLITGATGFVGSALIERLQREDVELSATVLEGEDAGLLPAEVGRIVVQPFCESSDCFEAVKDVGLVIHLAARVHIMRDRATDPLEEFRRVNVRGTERLARQAAQSGVKRFIFVSTVKVHGEESATPYREDSPIAPVEPYSVSKAEAEALLRNIAEETGLEVVIIRPPLLYGPNVKANFRQLMRIVGHNVPLPVAYVHNKRSFMFVGNLVDALVCCATHPKAAGQSYLVSDGEDISTPELIQRIAKSMGLRARMFPFPVGLLRFVAGVFGIHGAVERLAGSLQVDSSKIRRDLGWTPPYTLEQGLERTIFSPPERVRQ